MPVDAELQPILDLIAASDTVPPMEVGPAGLRELFSTMCSAFGSGPQDLDVSDGSLAGRDGPIPVRWYRPSSLGVGEPAPTLVFFHGGGFVIGSLDTHDTLCRTLADGAGIVVVSVDYRLAPEHPAPAGARDAVDALAAVIAGAAALGVDRDRVAVGGDSAGGNLAALAAIDHRRARAEDPSLPTLALQLLIYPVVDLRDDEDRFPSLRENGEGYFLTLDTMRFFEHHYLSEATVDASSPEISPLAVEDLSDLPPAFVLTAELDPLRDEGEAYAEALAAAGVPVTATRYDGAIHGFVQMGTITTIGRRGVEECVAVLRRALVDQRS